MAQPTPATTEPPNPTTTAPRRAPAHAPPRWHHPATLTALGLALIPLDPALHNALHAIEPRGDLRRELELLQQFGAPASVAIAFVLTLSLAPAKARRFLDWLLAACLTSLTVLALKILIARPRPALEDPFNFRTALRPYPVNQDSDPTPTYAWQVNADSVERLWSMPSSHTAAAVVFAVFLTIVFPRLRVFAIAMAALVVVCRVMFNAHWPSDTLIGAAVATAIAIPIIRHHAGIRLVDWFWIRFIDKNATPKWPGIVSQGHRA